MISARFHSSRLTRAVASLCIVTQVLFPVASTAGHRVAAPQAAPAVLSEQDATAAQVAGMTTQAAGMLQSGMNSRQAAEMARGYGTLSLTRRTYFLAASWNSPAELIKENSIPPLSASLA